MNFLDTIEQLGFSTWVRESPSIWAYPTILWLHVMGMGVVGGISALISLRLLGFSPKTALRPLERLYPLIWWGFGINAVTGTALLMASASARLVDPTFYIKMIFIFAGVAVLQLMRNKVFRQVATTVPVTIPSWTSCRATYSTGKDVPSLRQKTSLSTRTGSSECSAR